MAQTPGDAQPVAVPEGQAGQQPPAPQRSWMDVARSIIFQMVIFYFISSYFRGNKTPPPETEGPDGKSLPLVAGVNLFSKGQELELYVYLTSAEDFSYLEDRDSLLWSEELVYGNWEDGPSKDGTRKKTLNVLVPESVQQNGTWYLHVFIAKMGYTLDSSSKEYKEQAITYQSTLFNRYRKRRVHNTANLLTGESEVAPGTLKVAQGATDVVPDVISYYHPNLTINLVEDYTQWTPGSVPQPLDKFVEFDPETGGYYPVLYINNYWNLAQDYIPLNDTTRNVSLTFVYSPLTLFKFNMYAAMGRENPWSNMMGASDPTDDDQDTIKTTLLETNPYLLGLTVAVSILHSIFEFLAFKNDVQFWRSRKSLEGLSVRSVFFNVFQSLVVLLYILDNETNYVIIVSVFIGLCIELWKVTKVVEIKVDRDHLIAGLIPRITYVDKPSYKSATKEYDMLAFKYLGWVLFPLLICYAVYSVTYLEHKGWYSFILSMSYGFLLTFGFITMTPQLFINYKLKSVAHLPWRMLTYKALNTFIDDMFAFVIKMPTMYRIGCFRDDIVFFIFLYQRWIYRVDPKRVNEFGTSGEDHLTPQVEGATAALPPSGGDVGSDRDSAGVVEEVVPSKEVVPSEEEVVPSEEEVVPSEEEVVPSEEEVVPSEEEVVHSEEEVVHSEEEVVPSGEEEVEIVKTFQEKKND